MSSQSSTKVFLVTANIASCFDNPKAMLNTWLDEFFKVVRVREPHFVALHCQEVGGKNYETCMENVEDFLRNFLNRAAMLNFTRARLFIDEEYGSAEKFTALGSLYFLRDDVKDAQIWNFKDKRFVNVEGKEHYVGDIEDVPIKEKSKFPQEFFPECKWSRKGFLRTRWSLNGTLFDLVNIHLFHDASNFIAMEKFPSVYTLNRKRAMEHTLDRFHNDEFKNVPIFLFGDFNFRLDTGSVVQKLTEECQMLENVEDTGERTCEFRDKRDEKSVLSVSKKSFSHMDHPSIFLNDNGKWLRPFDKELTEFSPRLQEFPITFPPSYPFEEGAESKDNEYGGLYMKTRCPSWCDRVILNQSAKDLIDQKKEDVLYDIIGLNSRMGDHKPVGLCIHLPIGAGIVQCCRGTTHCPNFVHDPLSSCFVVGSWCRCVTSSPCPIDTPSSEVSSDVACPVYSDTNNSNHSVICNSSFPPPIPSVPLSGGVEPLIKDTNPPNKIGSPMGGNDLLKNLLKFNNGKLLEELSLCSDSKSGDPLLKRVHSDPIKVKNYCDRFKDLPPSALIHSNLIHSHSLDGTRKGKGSSAKLRLRAFSSRMISHHSSSSEEWFEEIPPDENEERDKVPTSQKEEPSPLKIRYESVSSAEMEENNRKNDENSNKKEIDEDEENFPSCTDSVLKPPVLVQQQNSLNNLLFPDNYNGHRSSEYSKDNDYVCDIKSVSNLSYQTDTSSVHKVSETNSLTAQPPLTLVKVVGEVDKQRSVSESNASSEPFLLESETDNPSVAIANSSICSTKSEKFESNEQSSLKCCCSVS